MRDRWLRAFVDTRTRSKGGVARGRQAKTGYRARVGVKIRCTRTRASVSVEHFSRGHGLGLKWWKGLKDVNREEKAVVRKGKRREMVIVNGHPGNPPYFYTGIDG